MSFKTQITDLAGSVGSITDATLQQWAVDGCYDVLNKLKAINPMEFAIQSDAYSGPMTVGLNNIREFIGAERNGYACRPVHHNQKRLVDPNDAIGSNSIYKATADDPVFYILNSTAVIKPNPTSTEQGYYSYIPEYSVSISGTEIDNFPNQYREHVVLYTATKTVQSLMNAMQTNTDITTTLTATNTEIDSAVSAIDKFRASGDDPALFGDETQYTTGTGLARVKDALDNAQYIIDNGASSPTSDASYDAGSFLADEDLELLQGALSMAATEMQRAQIHISAWDTVSKTLQAEIQSNLSAGQAYLAELNGRLQFDQQKYTWYKDTLRNLTQQYYSKFPSQGAQQGGQ